MNQYEVLYAVKDSNKENEFFAAVGEAPHPWRGWSLESRKVMAPDDSAVRDVFYSIMQEDDRYEYVFVKAQLIKKPQWAHPLVVAVKVISNPNGWIIRTIYVKTNSKTSGLSEILELAYQELQKWYPGISVDDRVFLERRKPEVCLDDEN